MGAPAKILQKICDPDHGQCDSSCRDRLAKAPMANLMGELLQKTPIATMISARCSNKFPPLRLPVFLWKRGKR
jgi:hypothetical protein